MRRMTGHSWLLQRGVCVLRIVQERASSENFENYSYSQLLDSIQKPLDTISHLLSPKFFSL
jgi:hypothetical protein